jgi:phage protein D
MVALSSPRGIVNSEPVLEIKGQPQPRLNAGLLSLMVEETTAGLYRCEARFGNWGDRGSGVDYLYFDRQLLDFGNPITVSLGADEGREEVFQGPISAIEGQFLQGEPPQIVVLAEDQAQSLRVTRRCRTFEQVTDADVFEQIAQEHRLKADIKIQGPTHQVIAQLNQSDLAFMRERARRLAAEIWIQGSTLHVQDRLSRQRSRDTWSLTYQHGLLEFSVIADTANQYTQVVVSGWDVKAKDAISFAATDNLLGSELNGDASGASIIQAKFRDRVDRIAEQVPLTTEEAQSLAEATFRAQARRFVVGTGRAWGDARIRVGRAINLQGLGPLFSGPYYVTETRHSFSRQPGGGYTTEFVGERPGIGQEGG